MWGREQLPAGARGLPADHQVRSTLELMMRSRPLAVRNPRECAARPFTTSDSGTTTQLLYGTSPVSNGQPGLAPASWFSQAGVESDWRIDCSARAARNLPASSDPKRGIHSRVAPGSWPGKRPADLRPQRIPFPGQPGLHRREARERGDLGDRDCRTQPQTLLWSEAGA